MAGAYFPFGRSGLSYCEWGEVKWLSMAIRSRSQIKCKKHTAGETQHGKAGLTNLSPS